MTRRLVTRHVWQDDLEQADTFTKTLNGKRIYAWRKQTIERSFAEAKELHGLRYARMLGIRNMYEQSFLTAAVQNMKRIVKAIFSCFISLLYAKTPYPLLKTWRFSAVWSISSVCGRTKCFALGQSRQSRPGASPIFHAAKAGPRTP